jgi:hypothetical protein
MLDISLCYNAFYVKDIRDMIYPGCKISSLFFLNKVTSRADHLRAFPIRASRAALRVICERLKINFLLADGGIRRERNGERINKIISAGPRVSRDTLRREYLWKIPPRGDEMLLTSTVPYNTPMQINLPRGTFPGLDGSNLEF